jgi:hypothetical protein
MHKFCPLCDKELNYISEHYIAYCSENTDFGPAGNNTHFEDIGITQYIRVYPYFIICEKDKTIIKLFEFEQPGYSDKYRFSNLFELDHKIDFRDANHLINKINSLRAFY